jgi:L-serine dehydratase
MVRWPLHGVGHGTGRAVILGLTGELPDQVDPDRMDAIIAERGEEPDDLRPAIPATISIRRPTLSSTRRIPCRATQTA